MTEYDSNPIFRRIRKETENAGSSLSIERGPHARKDIYSDPDRILSPEVRYFQGVLGREAQSSLPYRAVPSYSEGQRGYGSRNLGCGPEDSRYGIPGRIAA